MDRVGCALQIAGKFSPRDQSDSLTQVPVLELGPRLLPASDIDTCCCPGLAEGFEVTQDGVKRRVRPSAAAATALPVTPGDPVPVLRRDRSVVVVLIEPPQARQYALAGPPHPSRRKRCNHRLSVQVRTRLTSSSIGHAEQ